MPSHATAWHHAGAHKRNQLSPRLKTAPAAHAKLEAFPCLHELAEHAKDEATIHASIAEDHHGDLAEHHLPKKLPPPPGATWAMLPSFLRVGLSTQLNDLHLQELPGLSFRLPQGGPEMQETTATKLHDLHLQELPGLCSLASSGWA